MDDTKTFAETMPPPDTYSMTVSDFTTFLDWLQGATKSLVIEFVSPEDPMARRLLARKRPGNHPDYRADWFEQCLAERFEIARSESLAAGARTLYLARPKG